MKEEFRILILTVRNVYSLTVSWMKFFTMPYSTMPKRNNAVNIPIQLRILYRLANPAQGGAFGRGCYKYR